MECFFSEKWQLYLDAVENCKNGLESREGNSIPAVSEGRRYSVADGFTGWHKNRVKTGKKSREK